MINITLLGSTGSIGTSTLDVIRRHPRRFRLFALAANSSVDSIYAQVLEFRPAFAVLVDATAAATLRSQLASAGVETEVLDGEAALETVVSHPDVDAVMAAIVGAAGLRSAWAAAAAGKRVMLANKESLVVAGQLFMDAVAASGAVLLPVDSEHNAVFQCLPVHGRQGVRRILLTASGGPFRTHAIEQLSDITPEQACAHPNWEMGPKISVDSATMMNKGLEVIEACLLPRLDGAGKAAELEVAKALSHRMVERALRLGARGYVTKQQLDETLLLAIRRLLRGEMYLSARLEARLATKFVAGQTLETDSPLNALSDRELRRGREFCFLYTDLENPTSNRIYHDVGYRPVLDVEERRSFEAQLQGDAELRADVEAEGITPLFDGAALERI